MTYQENFARIKKIAVSKNLVINLDYDRVEKVVGLMTNNFNEHGAYFCPCKQINDIPQRGVDVVCPCPELDEEIKMTGSCHCSIFYK